MAPAQGPPLSLRPFPVSDKQPKNLAEFIARVNAQPGGFRDVTETKLEDEVKSAEDVNGASDHEDVDMSDAGGEDDAGSKDPNAARLEVLKNIEIAGNAAMLTLDSLSLLLSKQSPTQAGLTLSQQLRDMVGIGTLGADKLDEAVTNSTKVKDDEEVAIGWTLMEINKTRDAAQEAGSFLEREVEAEGKYWEDVMTVKQSGWSICRVPHQRHTLGVKFGFSEAAAEFKNNGLAPMRRGDDGSVELDLGRLGGVSEGFLVTYEKDGKVVGRSVPRRRPLDETSLESRVLEARNTIFAQELWHELTREARTLAAYDVRPQGSTLTCSLDDSSKIILELLPLESCPPADDSLPNNVTAETISLSLHVLLSYAHRYNELMRMRPIPPHVSRSRGQQVYALLRPVIARMTSIRSTRDCTSYIGNMVRALQKAGLDASFTLKTSQYSVVDPGTQGPNQPAGAQSMVRNMLQPIEFNINLTILPDTSLTIRGRTFLFPVTATYYHIVLPESSPLSGVCPPYGDGYSDTKGLFDYLRTATSRALTVHFLNKLSASQTSSSSLSSSTSESKWIKSVQGSSLRDADGETIEISFAMEEGRKADGGEANVAVVLSSSPLGDTKRESQSFRWSVGRDDSESRSLDAVVTELATQAVAS